MEPVSRTEQGWGELIGALPGKNCLGAQELIELLERGRRTEAYEIRMAHVSGCPSCRKLMKELRTVEQARPRRQRWRFGFPALFPIAAGAAAVALLYFAVASFLGTGDPTRATPRHFVERPADPEPEKPKDTRREGLMARQTPPIEPRIAPKKPKATFRRKTKPSPIRGGEKPRPSPEPDVLVPRIDRTLDATTAPAWSSSGSLGGEVLASHGVGGEVVDANTVRGTVGGSAGDRREIR